MKIFTVVLSILVFIVLIVALTLFKNNARLFDPPGFSKRLAVYLTKNTAQTKEKHPFAELTTPVFPVGPDELYLAVLDAAIELGWTVLDTDDVEWTLDLMVETDFLLFKDDVKVELKPQGCRLGISNTALDITAASRIGNVDFAANADHIQQLIKAVTLRLEQGRIY